MGQLKNIWDKFWTPYKEALNAPDHLKAAIADNNLLDACLAISHAAPAQEMSYDPIVKIIRDYSRNDECNPFFLSRLRRALYTSYDHAFSHAFGHADESTSTTLQEQTGYKNPLIIYALAAFADDRKKLHSLHCRGVAPDHVSASTNCGSMIMETIRAGAFKAFKEIVAQGAALDKAFGYDDFTPLHYFSKPLFHAYHPGVTTALLQTENPQILAAVETATGIKQTPKNNNPDKRGSGGSKTGHNPQLELAA